METTGRHRSAIPATWHDHPLYAPLLYGAAAMVTGAVGYTFGYLLTYKIHEAVAASLILNGLLVLYLRECHKEMRRRKHHGRIR